MIRYGFKKFARRIEEAAQSFILGVLMMPAKRRKGRTPFGPQELKLLHRALLSQNLCCVNGRMVPALEREFATAYGVPYAVASTSGTAAIHVALGALDLNPGDEVVTAPITDLGTIIPILYQGAIPVFADVDDTYNMDPAEVERKITPDTRAIIVVHLFGNPCNMTAMVDIARRHNIPLIEDCSQAHMTRYQGKYVGTIGDIGCFSFQQSKQMTTGDGGMTITSNEKFYERMKYFADKGYARKGWGPRAYLFHAPNYRMTELVGAVGLAQLKKVRAVVEKRFESGSHMGDLLAKVPSVRPAPVTPGAEHAYWLYPIWVEDVNINQLAREMTKQGVSVLAGYTGMPIYLCSESLASKKTYGDSQWPFTCKPGKTYEYREGLCPRAEDALKHLLCILWDESWTETDVEHAARVLEATVRKLRSNDSTSLPSRKPLGRELSSPAVAKAGKQDMVRIGIVGCGRIARWHFDAYKADPRVKLVAFADTDLERAETFARKVNAKAYDSHKAMIRNEALDGASICTVPSTHRDISLDLLDAGIHVLCEKPLATSVAEARQMVERAGMRNRVLMTAFKFRFHEEVLRAKELIENGGLGRILNVRVMFGGYFDAKETWYARRELSGGGIIMDNGPHAVDLIRYLFGEVARVSVEASDARRIGVEDTARLSLSLKDGAMCVVDLSWSVAVPAPAYLEIFGEDGAVLVDTGGISYKFKTWNQWKRIPNRLDAVGNFARQVVHFVDAILGASPTILGNGEGLASQIIIEAAYRALEQGSLVNVGDRD